MEVGWSPVHGAMVAEPKSRLPSLPGNARDAMVTAKSSALDAAVAAMHEVADEIQRYWPVFTIHRRRNIELVAWSFSVRK